MESIAQIKEVTQLAFNNDHCLVQLTPLGRERVFALVPIGEPITQAAHVGTLAEVAAYLGMILH